MSTPTNMKGGVFRRGLVDKDDFLHGNVETKKLFLGEILSDEIKVGFLMFFCENQYCTENIRFVVTANQYKNLFRSDGIRWKRWPQLDGDESNWQENQLDEHREHDLSMTLQQVAKEYLSSNSKYEICISEPIKERTNMRMKNYRVYGPEVFKEACIDPMNTLIKDILPRFVVSDVFLDMQYFLGKTQSLPAVDKANFTPPIATTRFLHSVQSTLVTEKNILDYCTNDVQLYFQDPLLYSYFLKYLVRIMAQENLLCVSEINKFNKVYELLDRTEGSSNEKAYQRNVNVNVVGLASTEVLHLQPPLSQSDYQQATTAELRVAVIQEAWALYLYFLAPGSAYEVGVGHSVHQQVSRTMACPSKNMFSDIKASAMDIVVKEFETFINQREYTLLLAAVRRRRDNGEADNDPKEADGDKPWGACLPFACASPRRSISPAL